MLLELIEWVLIAAVEEEIHSCLAQSPSVTDKSVPTPKKKTRRTSAKSDFDFHAHLYRITGVDFTSIDGLDVVTVQTIISEVGLDPTKFKSVKHFASWLGLCPGCRITGGKLISDRLIINN